MVCWAIDDRFSIEIITDNRNSVTFFGCKHVYAQKVRMYIVHELVNSSIMCKYFVLVVSIAQ